MLSADRDRTGDGERQRAAHADGVVEDRVDAAQVGSAKGRQAGAEDLVEGGAFVHATNVHPTAVGGGVAR